MTDDQQEREHVLRVVAELEEPRVGWTKQEYCAEAAHLLRRYAAALAQRPEQQAVAISEATQQVTVALDPERRVMSDWPYTHTFNAIAAAVKIEGTAIAISVEKFVRAWGAAPQRAEQPEGK